MQVDHYGRAWVPYFEGMSAKPHVNGVYVQAYKPGDVEAWCPGVFETAIAAFTVDPSAGWGQRTALPTRLCGALMSWTPATRSGRAQRFAGVGGDKVRLEPG